MYPNEMHCGVSCITQTNTSCIFKSTRSCAVRSAFITGLMKRRLLHTRRQRDINGNNQASPLSEYFGLLKVYLMTGFKCWYCGKRMKVLTGNISDPDGYTFDHRISLKNHGTNYIDNMVICCSDCNKRKGKEECKI